MWKKLTSLNYDNLKKYYVNLEGFLKLDNFFYLDGIDLFSELQVLQEILPSKDLNGLAILFIEQNLLENIEYKNLISDFVAETVCRVIFQWFFFFFFFLR